MKFLLGYNINCYLVRGINLWKGGGGRMETWWRESTGGEFFQVVVLSKFLAGGEEDSVHPPGRLNPQSTDINLM